MSTNAARFHFHFPYPARFPMADDAEKRGRPNHLKVRRWKITIPIALVGAITAPLVFGTWKMQPTSETWVPLTADQKAKLGTYMQNTENCRTFEAAVGDKVFCDMELAKLHAGGEYQYLYLSAPKYFALNFATALGAFIAVFGLTFFLPDLVRRYRSWFRK
jgi:hypothetical protein